MSTTEHEQQQALAPIEELKLWSVTTLTRIAMGESKGLVYWKLGKGAEASIDGRRVVDAMLQEGDRAGAVKWLVNAADRHSNQARDRGTRLHSALEALVLGQKPVLDDEIEPYVRHWSRWLDRYQPRFLMAEAPVYHPELRYAGTLDGVMQLDGWEAPLIFDYKSTEHPPTKENRPPFPEAALQIAAYSRAPEVGVLAERRETDRGRFYLYDPTKQHALMPPVDQQLGLVIVVSPYDCRAVPTVIDEETFTAFRYVTQVARFLIEKAPNVFRAALDAPEMAE